MPLPPVPHSFLATLSVATALLAGCAGVPVVESNVQSYAAPGATLGAGARYRFEPLPLQQLNDPLGQQALERLAEPALARAGLVRDDAAARLGVQLGASVSVHYPYAALPWAAYPGGFGFGTGYMRGGWDGTLWGAGPGYGWPPPQPIYHREVSVVLRDSQQGGRIVYQSAAAGDSRWWNDEAVFPAMFGAALEGFPTPPAGTRRVRMQLVARDGGNAAAADSVRAVDPAPAGTPSSGVQVEPPGGR